MSKTGKRGVDPLKENAPVPSQKAETLETQDPASLQVHPDQFYRTMVEQSLGLICAHDFAGNLLYVNPAAAQALGHRTDAWRGKTSEIFLRPRSSLFLMCICSVYVSTALTKVLCG